MVYGPIAAYLVEAFPAKIRYTSLSLPYHIGNGVFRRTAALDRIERGSANRKHLFRAVVSIVVAGVTFLVGSILLPETRHVRIWHEMES
jgi:hypothetical protein